MTGAELIAEVCGPLGYDVDNSTHATNALRWINEAQLDMVSKDWPELITVNDTFTTDGSETYDLTSEIDSGFYRIVDKSVRIGYRNMTLRDKSFIDQFDPANPRVWGNTAYLCGMVNRTTFWLWPPESSGETVTLDWVKKPATITAATEESSISFYTERHGLIVDGALWRGFRYEPDLGSNFEALRAAFENALERSFTRRSASVKAKSTKIIPTPY